MVIQMRSLLRSDVILGDYLFCVVRFFVKALVYKMKREDSMIQFVVYLLI